MNNSNINSGDKVNTIDNEISLKYIILKIRQWCLLIWLVRLRIISLSLLIGLTSATYTKFFSKETFIASYSLLFEENPNSMSSAMRLASSFGFSLGSGSSSSINTVMQYITSRDNIAKTMLANIEGGRLVERYYQKDLDEDLEFNREFNSKFDVNRRYTDSVLSAVTIELNKRYISSSLDEEIGVLNLSIRGENESFVYDLADLLINNTKKTFIQFKKKKSQSAVDAFQIKVDSLEYAIDVTLKRLGEYEDQNNSLVSSIDKIKRTRLAIDMEALKVSYGEYIKGLEMSKADLMNLQPPFKYFDVPTYPLKNEKTSVLTAGIFGFIFSGFLLVLFYVGRYESKILMAD